MSLMISHIRTAIARTEIGMTPQDGMVLARLVRDDGDGFDARMVLDRITGPETAGIAFALLQRVLQDGKVGSHAMREAIEEARAALAPVFEAGPTQRLALHDA